MSIAISGIPARVTSDDLSPGTVFTTPRDGGTLAIALHGGLAIHLLWLAEETIRPSIFRLAATPNDLFLFDDKLEIRLGGPSAPGPIRPVVHPTYCEVGSIWHADGGIFMGVDDDSQFLRVDLENWKAFLSKPASRFINHWTLWRINGEIETALATVDLKSTS